MSKFTHLLDPGHGGIINGIYQTAGKRSPKWQDGTQLFEGVFNRKVTARVIELCIESGIDCVDIVNSNKDISLFNRVKRANEYAKNCPCILWSIHANAAGKPNTGTGWEVFTSPGKTKSDKYAEILYQEAKKEFGGEFRMRTDLSDGDHDKEAKFYMLVKTSMPAVLSENFFMDTYTPDYKLISSDEGVERVAQIHFRAIKIIENE